MVEFSFEQLKAIKDAFLAKLQGEALERASRPSDLDEALSLGNMNQRGVYAGNIIIAHQHFIELLTRTTKYKTETRTDENSNKIEIRIPIGENPGYQGTALVNFVKGVFQGSGSMGAKRMEKTFETVGQLGQFRPTEGFSGDLTGESDEET